MEKDIIQPVNISILNDMLKEQERKYEKKIAELEKKLNKIKDIAERQNLCNECMGLEDCQRECSNPEEECATYMMKIILEIIEE